MKAKLTIPFAVLLALTLGIAGPSQARSSHGHGGAPARGHSSGRPAIQAHPGFQGRPGFASPRTFSNRGFAHPGFHRGHGGVVFGVTPFVVGPAFAYGYGYDPGYVAAPPAYSAPAQPYWYYCPSAGGYYPDVPSCPEPWVPVPAQ